MDVGSIILGRPWLFDVDVIIYDKSNTCVFLYEEKRYRIQPTEPKNHPTLNQKSVANKSIHILSAKGFENEAKDPSQVFALVAKEQITQPQMVVPTAVQPVTPRDRPRGVTDFMVSEPRFTYDACSHNSLSIQETA